jgi:hypothetical protein
MAPKQSLIVLVAVLMPTFIDESGDTGLNPNPENCHFRLAAVWIPSLDVGERIREDIRHLRTFSGLKNNYEFKFSKTGSHPERRQAFFNVAMRREAFHWGSAVWVSATLRQVYLAAQAAKIDGSSLRELVIVDDNGDKQFLDMLKLKFREIGSGLVGKVKFRGSGLRIWFPERSALIWG